MKAVSSAFACVAFLGCGATTTHYVQTGAAAAPYPGEVRIVMEASPAPPGFVEIAIVQAVGKGTHADLEHVIGGLQSEAAALGCDTIVRVRVDQGANQASATGVCGVVRAPVATAP